MELVLIHVMSFNNANKTIIIQLHQKNASLYRSQFRKLAVSEKRKT